MYNVFGDKYNEELEKYMEELDNNNRSKSSMENGDVDNSSLNTSSDADIKSTRNHKQVSNKTIKKNNELYNRTDANR